MEKFLKRNFLSCYFGRDQRVGSFAMTVKADAAAAAAAVG